MDYDKAHVDIKDLLKIQGSHGNWNYSPYMKGLYNGLELALSILDGDRRPEFKDTPEQGYLCDLPEPTDLPDPVAEEVGHV